MIERVQGPEISSEAARFPSGLLVMRVAQSAAAEME